LLQKRDRSLRIELATRLHIYPLSMALGCGEKRGQNNLTFRFAGDPRAFLQEFELPPAPRGKRLAVET
jgi:hypothetical protein